MALRLLSVAALSTAAAALPAAAPRCNPEQAEAAVDQRWTAEINGGVAASGGAATAVMLPQDKGGESPACLDGSP